MGHFFSWEGVWQVALESYGVGHLWVTFGFNIVGHFLKQGAGVSSAMAGVANLVLMGFRLRGDLLRNCVRRDTLRYGFAVAEICAIPVRY